MKCEQVILYASDELSPTDKTAFEMHLQQCNKCQAHLKLLRGLEETAQAKTATPSSLNLFLSVIISPTTSPTPIPSIMMSSTFIFSLL